MSRLCQCYPKGIRPVVVSEWHYDYDPKLKRKIPPDDWGYFVKTVRVCNRCGLQFPVRCLLVGEGEDEARTFGFGVER